ncbi:unnamed protein product, partial [Cylicostephanus goldi]
MLVQIRSPTGSKDLQMVNIGLRVLSRPNPEQLALIERALDFNIILDDVSLTELAFSPQYSAAVEAKQVAAQEAQRASFLVERAKQQRQEKIVQAEGEAASAKMVCFHICLRKPSVFIVGILTNFVNVEKFVVKDD